MTWTLERTDTFLQALRKHQKNTELLRALDKKMQRLATDPYGVGGMLSGELYGWCSTRLVRKFRLLFKIDDTRKVVFLGVIDHRGQVYD